MKKEVNFHILQEIFSFMRFLNDDEWEVIYKMNENDLEKWIFNETKKNFQKFGPKSKQTVLSSIEYLIHENKVETQWYSIFPEEEFGIDINKKNKFIIELYIFLTGHTLPTDFNIDSLFFEKRSHFANMVYSR